MADPLQPCCERARAKFVTRLLKAIVSYPVIKQVPCPTCLRVIPIRLYAPPPRATDAA